MDPAGQATGRRLLGYVGKEPRPGEIGAGVTGHAVRLAEEQVETCLGLGLVEITRRRAGHAAHPGLQIQQLVGVDVIARYTVPKAQVPNELKRFKAAVKKSRDELRAIIENTSDDFRQQTSILETQEVLIKDKLL